MPTSTHPPSPPQKKSHHQTLGQWHTLNWPVWQQGQAGPGDRLCFIKHPMEPRFSPTRKCLSQLAVSKPWILVLSEFSLHDLFPPLPDCGFIAMQANWVGNTINSMERNGRDFPRNTTTATVPGAPPCTTAAPRGSWKQLACSSYLESEQRAPALQPPWPASCQPRKPLHGQLLGQGRSGGNSDRKGSRSKKSHPAKILYKDFQTFDRQKQLLQRLENESFGYLRKAELPEQQHLLNPLQHSDIVPV